LESWQQWQSTFVETGSTVIPYILLFSKLSKLAKIARLTRALSLISNKILNLDKKINFWQVFLITNILET
jgi:hypothetical protein